MNFDGWYANTLQRDEGPSSKENKISNSKRSSIMANNIENPVQVVVNLKQK